MSSVGRLISSQDGSPVSHSASRWTSGDNSHLWNSSHWSLALCQLWTLLDTNETLVHTGFWQLIYLSFICLFVWAWLSFLWSFERQCINVSHFKNFLKAAHLQSWICWEFMQHWCLGGVFSKQNTRPRSVMGGLVIDDQYAWRMCSCRNQPFVMSQKTQRNTDKSWGSCKRSSKCHFI